MSSKLNLKVALVHDYLIEYGGAERVVEVLHELFPEAVIYTAYLDLDGLGLHKDRIKTWQIKTSWLQKVPFAKLLISPFRIFAPRIFEHFDLTEYDLVISSCNVYFSKAVKVKPGSLHLSYIHTPPHYLYGYATSFNYKKHWWTRIGGEMMNHFLRIYDYQTSQRPDVLIANSENVAKRIEKFYRRKSVVIYPPVILGSKSDSRIEKGSWTNSPRGEAGQDDRQYFLSVGRLVRGKGMDTIVAVCTQLGLPLKVAGIGPELQFLKSIAGKSIQFLGQIQDEQLSGLYAGAQATIVASKDEDFGIVPVESMAAGTPVIAMKSGGYLETIIDGKTGTFFEQNLIEVLKSFDPQKFKAEDCIKQADKFSKEKFKKEILKLIDSRLSSRIRDL